MNELHFEVKIASEQHLDFIPEILHEIEESAKERGTGIARRSAQYIKEKILEGKAIIAVSSDGEWAGFCYIETWSDKTYVANSGLIVNKKFRKSGLAKRIKEKTFEYSRQKFPGAKLFGLTTGLAVMKINSDLGYRPVTYSELTQDTVFWDGCKSCVNYSILMSKEGKNCLCTAMLYSGENIEKKKEEELSILGKRSKGLSSLKKIKELVWKK